MNKSLVSIVENGVVGLKWRVDMEDSTIIKEWYGHPEDGQGVYTMIDAKGRSHWCFSGNEMSRVYKMFPENYLTGPIYLHLSKEDYDRLYNWLEDDITSW